MTLRSESRVFIWFCIYSMLAVATIAEMMDLTKINRRQCKKKCGKNRCRGPVGYYDALNCASIIMDEDCCAVNYDCSYIKNNYFNNTCYYKGMYHSIGQNLAEAFLLPCETDCICEYRQDGTAGFTCHQKKCHSEPPKPGCYRKHSPGECCPGEEVCPEKPEDRAICKVKGNIYRDGEHFEVNNKRDLICVCQPGYKGENIEPFCKRVNRIVQCAGSELNQYGKHITDNCAPIYKQTRTNLFLTACIESFRCPNPMDAVVPTFGCDHVLWKANEEKLKDIVLKRNLEVLEKPWITIDDLENPMNETVLTLGCNHSLWRANEEKIKDIVLKREPENNSEKPWKTIDDFDHCLFGDIKMALDEELAQDTDLLSNTSSCVRCVCEIPPVPTCIRLSNCTPRPFNLSEPLYSSTKSP